MLSNSHYCKSKATGQVSDAVCSGHHVPRTNKGASAFEKCLPSSVPLVTQVDQPWVLTDAGILPSHYSHIWCSWTTGRLRSKHPQGRVGRVGVARCSCLFLGDQGSRRTAHLRKTPACGVFLSATEVRRSDHSWHNWVEWLLEVGEQLDERRTDVVGNTFRWSILDCTVGSVPHLGTSRRWRHKSFNWAAHLYTRPCSGAEEGVPEKKGNVPWKRSPQIAHQAGKVTASSNGDTDCSSSCR